MNRARWGLCHGSGNRHCLRLYLILVNELSHLGICGISLFLVHEFSQCLGRGHLFFVHKLFDVVLSPHGRPWASVLHLQRGGGGIRDSSVSRARSRRVYVHTRAHKSCMYARATLMLY